MNREVLINIINRGRIRFIPVRRCFLCNEYVGYKFVRMCDGSMIPVFSSGLSKKQVMSWAPKGQAVDGSGWVISFHLSFGLESGTQIKFDREEEYQRALDSLNERFNVIL